MKAYWKKDGAEIGDLLKLSAADYAALRQRCAKFDAELMADLEQAGGPKYAWICALAYRQSLAASKVVADANGQPLYFCKENTCNGCMGTVDVFYPQAPLPLLISPSLAKAMLIPVLEYASRRRGRGPTPRTTWAPGHRPTGRSTAAPSSNGGMPVEETGNMLLLVAAVAQVEGNADFAGKYWPMLTKWAQYLEQFGRDPENQLCTDDFAGHLAHNANLAGKAICALGAYGKLAGMRGEAATADKYAKMAREFALGWMQAGRRRRPLPPGLRPARHVEFQVQPRLGQDPRPEPVSRGGDQEGDGLLPQEHRQVRPAAGRAQAEAPAGNRAGMLEQDRLGLLDGLPDGQPRGFRRDHRPDLPVLQRGQAPRGADRPVLHRPAGRGAACTRGRSSAGIFIKMLYNQEVWKKWASRDKTNARGPWARVDWKKLDALALAELEATMAALPALLAGVGASGSRARMICG